MRWPVIESRMRWRSSSVPASVEPFSRNLMFAQASRAIWRRDTIPCLYAARPKWIALEPSMRVLSRSKKAAPGMRLTLVSGDVDAELEMRIRDAYAAFAEGDIENLREFWHEDATYVNPPYAMEAGTREGRDALEEIWMGIHSLFEFDTVDVLEVAEGTRGVLVVLRYRGKGKTSGAPVDVPMAHVLDIRDGRVARLAWYGTRDEAAEAAGL